jgi:hypothetical protein
VLHVVLAALLGTPVAYARAQGADLAHERTVPCHGVGGQPANRRTFDAATWAIVVARLANHVREAISAGIGAGIAGREAVENGLSQVVAHRFLLESMNSHSRTEDLNSCIQYPSLAESERPYEIE